MLHEFVTVNREEIIRRCRAKVAKRYRGIPQERAGFAVIGMSACSAGSVDSGNTEPRALHATKVEKAGRTGFGLVA